MGKFSIDRYSRFEVFCQWLQFSLLFTGCVQNQERPPLPEVRLQVAAKPGIGVIGKQTDFWKTRENRGNNRYSKIIGKQIPKNTLNTEEAWKYSWNPLYWTKHREVVGEEGAGGGDGERTLTSTFHSTSVTMVTSWMPLSSSKISVIHLSEWTVWSISVSVRRYSTG